MKGSYAIEEFRERFSISSGLKGIHYRGIRDNGDEIELWYDDGGCRVVADHDGWTVRAGTVGDEVLWSRGDDEHATRAAGVTGSSPSYDLAVATMLGLAVGETRRVTLLEVTEPVGAARTVEHGWARTADPDEEVQRYEVADLQTAERWVLHLSGGVLLSREGRSTAVLVNLDVTV